MAIERARPVYLNLHGLDGQDFQRYRDRLDHLFDIVDTAQKIELDTQSEEGVYRLQVDDQVDLTTGERRPNYHEVRVSTLEMAGAIGPVVRMSATHTDFVADFAIHDCLYPGDKQPAVDDYNDVLDIIERWIRQLEGAYTLRGYIGASCLESVEQAELKAAELLNAVVHAYMEFQAGEKFLIAIQPRQPYGEADFYHVNYDQSFRFLSPETRSAIDRQLPKIVKLHYSAVQSVCQYWLGPPDEVLFEVSRETLPNEIDLRRALKALADIPAPHLLDTPEPVETEPAH